MLISAKRNEIEKRLRMLDGLLAVDTGVHPAGCNCAIKSRDETHHAKECPYRMLKELVPMLRSSLLNGAES